MTNDTTHPPGSPVDSRPTVPATADDMQALERLHRQLAPLAALEPGDRADRLRHGPLCELSSSVNNRHAITVLWCECGIAALDHFIRTGEVCDD
jgi:hypothetical protein